MPKSVLSTKRLINLVHKQYKLLVHLYRCFQEVYRVL